MDGVSFQGVSPRWGVCWLGLVLVLAGLLNVCLSASADPCPFCRAANGEAERFCCRCLRPLSWTDKPLPTRYGLVAARRGVDAFIRGPNDNHPRQTSDENGGMDRKGPIGSYYSLTGLRYLLRFDIPDAFHRAGVSLEDYQPGKILLVIRVASLPAAIDDIPIVVHPLRVPFQQGWGRWGKHYPMEHGCTWFLSGQRFPWKKAGGDYLEDLRAQAMLPKAGFAEVEIDVTALLNPVFREYRLSGVWNDPGLLIMRDSSRATNGYYRLIHSFESAPESGMTSVDFTVLSPELIFR